MNLKRKFADRKLLQEATQIGLEYMTCGPIKRQRMKEVAEI